MTDSDIRTAEWKTIPGFSAYEASHRGKMRSVDRTGRDGRFRKGAEMKTRIGSSGYPQVNLVRDDGAVRTVAVHVAVLLAHAGPCPPGMEASHANDDPLDNRWPENLAWETKPQNERRKFENGRPRPVPPRQAKRCVRCGEEFAGNGRRCHPCVVEIGKLGAGMLRAGVKLKTAAAQLGYPSAEGLHTLAVKYGGYGQPWTRRALVTLRDLLRGVTRRNRRRAGDSR